MRRDKKGEKKNTKPAANLIIIIKYNLYCCVHACIRTYNSNTHVRFAHVFYASIQRDRVFDVIAYNAV